MLAEDEDYTGRILSIIADERCNAEYAVDQAGRQFEDMFSGMDDEYMRARAADIRDVTRRIIGCLTGAEESGIDSDGPVILAADDLAPSETVRLDRKKVLGFIMREGSVNSHTAILARSMGIPAVSALGDSLKEEYDGMTACVDGEDGSVVIDPDEAALDAWRERVRKQREARELLETLKGQEDVALDGRRMHIYCNIASPEDVEAVIENDGRGIGLFRTEFLYLAAGDYPGEEEQFMVYKSVAAAMKGKTVVIRTLDIGTDKQADYFGRTERKTLRWASGAYGGA